MLRESFRMFRPNLQEAHYCHLSTQSNVYGLTQSVLPCGKHKILVSSLQGKVISLEFQKTKPLSREVHFTYIPGDAEIISIDAFSTFSKRHHDVGIRVGISFIKHGEGESMHHFLNIYSEWEKDANYDLDRIAQGCQTLDLNFVPYQLYHTELNLNERTETVFLLSGGDQKIHLYRELEDRSLQTLVFNEEEAEQYFPEFADLPSNVVCMQCMYIANKTQRVTSLGCLDGSVRVALVSTLTTEILKLWTIQHDSPITSLNLFKLQTEVSCPAFIKQCNALLYCLLHPHDAEAARWVYPSTDVTIVTSCWSVVRLYLKTDSRWHRLGPFPGLSAVESIEDTSYIDSTEYNLLVTSALEVAVVYRNVLENGLNDVAVLPGSDHYDCVLCSHVADLDFDGQNEILLGAYGQELLLYKFYPKSALSMKSTPEKSSLKQLSDELKNQSQLSTSTPVKNQQDYSTKPNASFSMALRFDNPVDIPTDSDDKPSMALLSKSETTTSTSIAPHEIKPFTSELNLSTQTDPDENDGPRPGVPPSPILGVEGNTSCDQVTGDISSEELVLDGSEVGAHCTPRLTEGEFKLEWQRTFPDPILALDEMDITGDGLNEIIVVSLKGVHVLQQNLVDVARLCSERLRQAQDLQHDNMEDDAFQLLLTENLNES